MAAIDFPNSPSLNQEFSVGSKTWIWDGVSWNSKVKDIFTNNPYPKKGYSYFNDMLYLPDTTNDILNTAVSSGSSSSIAAPFSNRVGVYSLDLLSSSGTSGRSQIYTSNASLITFSSQYISSTIYETSVYAPALSVSTANIIMLAGFGYSLPNVLSGNTYGIFFIYDSTGLYTGTASPNWQVVLVNNSTKTSVTTSVAVAATTWYKLRIEISSTPVVNFYINGNLVATPVTTNFPSSVALAPFCSIHKSASVSGALSMYIDYLYFEQQTNSNYYR
jgi:hypothetical protein